MNEVATAENIQENDVYIFVKIGNSSYAFPALNVLEIIKLVELEYPEKMPSYIAGILDYKGKIINIIDLRTILKIDVKEYDVNTHILIIQSKESIYGIISDEITDIKKIDSAIVSSPSYSLIGSFTKGIYLNNGESIAVINLESLENWIRTSNTNETSFNEKAARLLPRDIRSKEILHQRKLQLLEKTQNIPYKNIQNKDAYISFIIGNSTYCLEIAYVGGFYKYSETKIIKIPCTPNFVAGLISIKGDYLTVIDLKRYFDNEPSKITDKATIIVIQSQDFKVGFIADEISANLNIQAGDLFPNKNEVIEYVKDNKLYLVLNVAEILNNEKIYVG